MKTYDVLATVANRKQGVVSLHDPCERAGGDGGDKGSFSISQRGGREEYALMRSSAQPPSPPLSTTAYTVPGEFYYNNVLYNKAISVDSLEKIKHLKVHKDDVYIAGYPKSGTTWLQEIVYLIQSRGDFTKCDEIPTWYRVPFLEGSGGQYESLNTQRREGCVIKTHLHAHLLPAGLLHHHHQHRHHHTQERTTVGEMRGARHCVEDGGSSSSSSSSSSSGDGCKHVPKVIYVMRNPKDVCVSYYYFYKSYCDLGLYDGTWEEYVRMFLSGKVVIGDWLDHVTSWWRHRDVTNLLILQYEDMVADPRGAIRAIAQHLDKQLDDTTIDAIAQYTSFTNMRDNPMTNFLAAHNGLGRLIRSDISPFMRKGVVGDWQNHLTAQQNQAFHLKYNQRLHDEGLHVRYQIT